MHAQKHIHVAYIVAAGLLLCVGVGGGVQGHEFTVGPEEMVPAPSGGLPIYRFCPDGHIPFFMDADHFQMYWAGSTSYRSVGASLTAMEDAQVVLEPGPKGSYDNGGAWLNAVFKERSGAKRLIGFYHAEDHTFDGDPWSKYTAWKSIARCTSSDGGITWQKDRQIITSNRLKPRDPAWGGCGDFCVVRDEAHRRWLCFYQEHFLCVAVSDDDLGKPGTWHKLYQGSFSEAGLGGRSTPIQGLDDYAGGNPSVHFNTHLKAWVMVWGTWDQGSPHPNSVWLAYSEDLLVWSRPTLLVQAPANGRCWYPTIIGRSDVLAGEQAWLCYAHFADKSAAKRKFVVRQITFKRVAGGEARTSGQRRS